MSVLPTALATFNKAAAQTITDATAICTQRGDEYQDSWALENLKTPWLDNLLAAYPSSPTDALRPAWRRLIVMASLIDVKLSRLSGAYKADTALDSINYVAAYNTLRLEFDKHARATQAQPAARVFAKSEYVPDSIVGGLGLPRENR